jgi:hypothetical protein
MINTSIRVNITEQHKAILQTVLYFDIFKHPMKEKEIAENCGVTISAKAVRESLAELLTYGYLKQVKDYFMPHWADIDNVPRREKANACAEEMMAEAYTHSKKVSRLPFIKGLCISGSLSKNYFDEKSDVDFFVITKGNRLWICRTIFALVYRLTPKRKEKFYCLNYFISEADLKIEDKNIFVATELVYLIPTFGYDSYLKLMETNSWSRDWMPNKSTHEGANCDDPKPGLFKRLIESFFIGKFGDKLDEYLQKITARRWTRNHSGDLDQRQFEVQYRARRHVAKRHSKGHQEKVLTILAQKIKDMGDTFQQKLN